MIARAAHANGAIGLKLLDSHAKDHTALVEAEFGFTTRSWSQDRIAGPPSLHAGLRRNSSEHLIRRCIDGNVEVKVGHLNYPCSVYVRQFNSRLISELRQPAVEH